MPHLGVQELLIILVVVLLIFGGRKIPDLAKGLGEGIREFKKASKEFPRKDPPDDDGSPRQLDASRDDKAEASGSPRQLDASRDDKVEASASH